MQRVVTPDRSSRSGGNTYLRVPARYECLRPEIKCSLWWCVGVLVCWCVRVPSYQ